MSELYCYRAGEHWFHASEPTVGDTLRVLDAEAGPAAYRATIAVIDRLVLLGQSSFDVLSVEGLTDTQVGQIVVAMFAKRTRIVVDERGACHDQTAILTPDYLRKAMIDLMRGGA